MMGFSWSRRALIALLLAGATAAVPPAAAASGADLARAQEMIDAGRPDQALLLLERLDPGKGRDKSAEAANILLLRSTARFMLGQMELGRRDLDRSLEIDPRLRQGWLNRAALDIADGELDRALEALERARALDPAATDTDLNIGAVMVMQGRAGEAQPFLDRYLAANRDSADAWYLVASNYALGGENGAAVEHLTRAIALDERIRLRSRTDPNFAALGVEPTFQQLLNTDSYRIPAGSYAVYRTFEARYFAGDGKLLPAVIDALQLTGEPFDRQIEVTPDWALIWGEMRIKVRNDPHEGGRVELTAPRTSFSEDVWKARSGKLLAEVAVQLAKR